ncbi:hypothetical protein D1AOALGA4SA_12645 [Olavius algarvensis Delta 1 endosymbiont]|nr:hypothetical protein D1AOALGA4SA_12645 [Olavius algarvensis Delta 1 endosymbiont]
MREIRWQMQGFRCQTYRRPNKLPVKSKKKLLLIYDATLDCGSGF